MTRALSVSGSTIGASERGDGPGLERNEVRLGFMALSDCAPLVIAKERGFFRRQGLSVTLERQASWASIRDKVVHGLLDGAQMLAPMPLACTLGLDGITTPMVVPMALSAGGNAITVSTALHARMREADPTSMQHRSTAGRALRQVIRDARRAGQPPLRFAVVYPYSSHHHQLCYWMATEGIDPLRDVALSVIPPAGMARALGRGDIDGYAVGEPWNQLAVDQGIGVPLISSNEIWRSAPEKVFAVTAEWAERHPGTLRALVRALLEAAEWLDRPENRLEAVHVIAGESYVDAPVATVAGSMARVESGEFGRSPAHIGHVFSRHAATYPWVSHALWFLTQMVRWGQIEKPIPLRALAAAVYRPDLHRDAVEDLGLAFPEIAERNEGSHAAPWILEHASEPIEMGADCFLDGRVFRPEDPVAYLESFEVSALRVRLDDLALVNAE